MGKYWKLLAEYDAESLTYTACAGGAQASPYTPTENAKLVGLRVEIGRDAATSLINSIQWKLTSTTFSPNSIEVGGTGTGIQTAPAFQPAPTDWAVDQQVQAGVPITVEARNVTADTPVTVCALLWGYFEV